MRLFRTDLVPVMTIVAGGAIGLSLSLNFLLLPPAGDVPVRARISVVTGQVTNGETGRSIAAAQVFISSLDVGGLTRQNGRYLLQNVPAGEYTLSVARIGYKTTWVRIVVDGDPTVEQDFALSADAAYPYGFAPTVRLVPASRPVPTSDEIKQRHDQLLRALIEDRGN